MRVVVAVWRWIRRMFYVHLRGTLPPDERAAKREAFREFLDALPQNRAERRRARAVQRASSRRAKKFARQMRA